MIEYKEVIKKLTIELDVNENELSKLLGISQQALTERKKNNATKYDGIINLCLERQIDLNSLFQEDSKIMTQGFNINNNSDKNGLVDISEAYNSWKIPNNILHLFQLDKKFIYKAYTIGNDVMSPLINKYDSVIIKSLEHIPSANHKIFELNDGDLVLFKLYMNYHTNLIYCRRIYFISKNRYILKADNNNIPDIKVSYEMNAKVNGNYDMDKSNIYILGIVDKIIKNRL